MNRFNYIILFFIGFLSLQITESVKFRFLNKNSRNIETKKHKYSQFCDQVKTFSTYIDHFSNFQSKNNGKFDMRFISYDGFWSKGQPIFFYTGNEGDIVWFCENTGFLWELAKELSAMVVFAEHRYYGQSLPFGNDSFSSPYIDYLSSEQALADYAYLIKNFKMNYSAESSAVISFGGSYGGMLSAWFRMKYPNIVQGALAASAPVFQYATGCESFNNVTTNAFRKADPDCPTIIRSSWDIINQLSATDEGLKQLSSIFRLCKPLTSKKDAFDLKDWLNEIYGDIAMSNYPYATNFLNPLPGWPVKAMCSNITKTFFKTREASNKDPLVILDAIYAGINVYQNYTGDSSCFDISSSTPIDINMVSWTYQTCTEFVFPMCSDGVNDMFEPVKWDFDAYSAACKEQFDLIPRMEWAPIYYGSSVGDIKSHSNIIFSNGDLDPWSSGGVIKSINEKLQAIFIENGAHHLDLRDSNPNDPKSVVLARKKEKLIIISWLDEYSKMTKRQEKH